MNGPDDASGPFEYDTARWRCRFNNVPIGEYWFDATANVAGYYVGSNTTPFDVLEYCPCFDPKKLQTTTPGSCVFYTGSSSTYEVDFEFWAAVYATSCIFQDPPINDWINQLLPEPTSHP